MTLRLKSIEEEAAACRKAWKASKAKYGWHVHHEVKAEALTEPIEHRIDYILRSKPKSEQALRLRLLRPVQSPAVAPAQKAYAAAVAPAQKAYDAAVAPAQKAYDAAVAPAQKAYDAAVAPAHAKECPDCPWTAHPGSIFGDSH